MTARIYRGSEPDARAGTERDRRVSREPLRGVECVGNERQRRTDETPVEIR